MMMGYTQLASLTNKANWKCTSNSIRKEREITASAQQGQMLHAEQQMHVKNATVIDREQGPD